VPRPPGPPPFSSINSTGGRWLRARLSIKIGFVLKLVIGIWLLFPFGREFNHSADCFGTRWKVGLSAPPVVYSAQKVL
jgi:hypothetical protein